MSPPAICCGTTPSFAITSPAKPPMRIFRPLRSSTRVDLLAEPAAHLGAGIAARHAVDALRGVELVQQVDAAAVVQPGVLLARVEAERHRGAEGEGRVLAPVVVGGGVAHLDGAGRDRVRRLQAGDQFAGREDLDLELAVGRIADEASPSSRRAKDRVERLGKLTTSAPASLSASTARSPAAGVAAAARRAGNTGFLDK